MKYSRYITSDKINRISQKFNYLDGFNMTMIIILSLVLISLIYALVTNDTTVRVYGYEEEIESHFIGNLHRPVIDVSYSYTDIFGFIHNCRDTIPLNDKYKNTSVVPLYNIYLILLNIFVACLFIYLFLVTEDDNSIGCVIILVIYSLFALLIIFFG